MKENFVVEIARARFTIVFSLAIGIIKKSLKTTKTKKSMITLLCWLKVKSVASKR